MGPEDQRGRSDTVVRGEVIAKAFLSQTQNVLPRWKLLPTMWQHAPPGRLRSCKTRQPSGPRPHLCASWDLYVSPSAIRGNLVAHRPLDRSLSSPQAGIVNVVNSVPYSDPCAVSGGIAQEVTARSKQAEGIVKGYELSQLV